MKNLLSISALFLLTNLVFAQTLKGVVIDQDQNLLFGATVYNSTNSKSTITNEEGVFAIESTKGENKLVISYVGHTPKVINLDGSSIDLGTIILENNSLDEVVVSGTLRQVSKLKSAVQIELYTAKFLEPLLKRVSLRR
ncbi:carboxypeptidase-like regulatory domain-containing protein [Flavobacteriaceae bacterium]|nr:carboxypeptidase-like regulatory domain-containing protein [Flavobacteriaceae bacterium]